MSITGQDLIVNRADLSDIRAEPSEFPSDLPDGACLLKIDSFALTANNITYAVAPPALKYWEFFPANHDGFGRIPVWGFAEVIHSAHPQIPVGKRVYGYLPMSTHLMVQPGRITPFGFTDTSAHRAEGAPIYNQYAFTDSDPNWQSEQESLISLFRPLFTTSFLLDDLHRSQDLFGAKQIILSSASSKTAFSLAHLLSQDQAGDCSIVGLTSAGNRDFVQKLGCYDRVATYDELNDLPKIPTAFVDMAGNVDLLRNVHSHFDDALKNSCRVGLTHWQSTGAVEGLPGPRPEFFFAPTYALDRIKDWGNDGFQSRLTAAWQGFIGPASGWINVVESRGAEAAMATYLATLRGKTPPTDGHILSL